jgi:DNA end-binding protein Ku
MAPRAPRAIWSGAISFGLVNIPVRMYSAIDERDLHFHLLHTKDNGRIAYAKMCKLEDKPVPDDEVGRAYEVAEGEYVYLTDEDLEAAEGATYRTIDLTDFVPYEEIDPIYFEKTFFLGPAEGAVKVYALLVKALERSGLVGVGMFVMRDKQQLGCVRVRDGVLTLEKMYFADEIRPTTGIKPSRASVSRRELEMAEELIERFSGSFDIRKYRDEYRRAVLAVIRAKQKGETVEAPAPEQEEAPDLLAALRASLEARTSRRSPPKRRARR